MACSPHPVDILPGAVVGRVEHQRILVETEGAQLVHDATDASIKFDD